MNTCIFPAGDFVKAPSSDWLNLHYDYDNTFNLWSVKDMIRNAEYFTLRSPNINRFYERTLIEALKYISVGNKLEVIIKDNNHLTWFGLKSVLEKLFPNDFHSLDQKKSGEYYHLYFQRRFDSKTYLREKNSGWSIGILTMGDRMDYVKTMIQSVVKNCKTPYEIIVMCPHKLLLPAYVNQMHFKERDNFGWITKKKNLICEEAKYSDIIVAHDRFYLSDSFFPAMNNWGYGYGLAVPHIETIHQQRGTDWAVVSSENRVWSTGGLLDYRDYSPYSYAIGGFNIIRKEFWKKFKWNENFYWNEHEDVELSRRIQRNGDIIYLADALIHSYEDRWQGLNRQLPFEPQVQHLNGVPVGEQVITFVP